MKGMIFKMKKSKILIVLLLVLIMAISFVVINAIADFGDYSGGSDYGGGGGDYS